MIQNSIILMKIGPKKQFLCQDIRYKVLFVYIRKQQFGKYYSLILNEKFENIRENS